MDTRLVVSVWTSGNARYASFIELDKAHNIVSRTSWPITYTEGCDLAGWATAKARSVSCSFTFNTDGWNLYVPMDRVMEESPLFVPLHNNHRTEPQFTKEYIRLSKEGYHTSVVNGCSIS